jgi:hypothetical protein
VQFQAGYTIILYPLTTSTTDPPLRLQIGTGSDANVLRCIDWMM